MNNLIMLYMLLIPIDKIKKKNPKVIKSIDLGSYVTLNYPDRPLSKLHPVRCGPYIVVNKEGNKYFNQHLLSNSISEVHIEDLQVYDPSRDLDPTDSILADTTDMIIKKIGASKAR